MYTGCQHPEGWKFVTLLEQCSSFSFFSCVVNIEDAYQGYSRVVTVTLIHYNGESCWMKEAKNIRLVIPVLSSRDRAHDIRTLVVNYLVKVLSELCKNSGP